MVVALAVSDGLGASRPGRVFPVRLTYRDGKGTECFSDAFLRHVQRRTSIWVSTRFREVALGSAELFRHPFAVLSGDRRFELTEAQRRRLRAYLRGGGFLLASASCGSDAWARSFRRAVGRLFPDGELAELSFDHPLFHTLYEIETLKTKEGETDVTLEALRIRGRVAVVFAPRGLNDTANAGEDCCCCGADEIASVRRINANILAYALSP